MRRSLFSRQEDHTHGYRWRFTAHRSCGSNDGAVVIAITSGFIRHCERCSAPYDWRRSTSRSLRMTYCNSLCEAADLGGTIESMLLVRRRQEAVALGPDAALSSTALDDLWSVLTCPRCDSSVSGHARTAAYGSPRRSRTHPLRSQPSTRSVTATTFRTARRLIRRRYGGATRRRNQRQGP